ncbi:MAG: hypothetical protein HFACDABA_00357 [Anaerolineales bacterium]|nr:hypothetical protein [Anaerolineales bacterium]
MRLPDLFKKPLIVAIAAGVLGLVLGLFFAWMVWPTQWTDATPAALSGQAQEDYLRMAIDSFELNQDTDLAWIRIQQVGVEKSLPLLQKIASAPGLQDPGIAANFRDRVASATGGAQQPPSPDGPTDDTPSLLANQSMVIAVSGVLALAVLVGVVYLFWRRFIRGRSPSSPEEYSPARQAQEITRAAADAKTDFSKMGLQEPTSRTMTTYVLGDDLYDESFSIDAQNGDFLGEYGVGVSDAIGVGDPKKVTAIEIWLFDKNDIKTATKVLMTPHAFNDPNLRAKLEAKGELVQIEPHGQTLLETATLQLLATVVDLEFGQGNLPPKSHFERITLELAVWPKG